jgi:hypothetical protein
MSCISTLYLKNNHCNAVFYRKEDDGGGYAENI